MSEQDDRVVLEVTDEDWQDHEADRGWRLVDFYAQWCPHCKAFRPAYEQVAAEYEGPARLLAADVDQAREAARRFGVRSIPTLVLLRDGEEAARHVGAMQAPQLLQWLADQVQA